MADGGNDGDKPNRIFCSGSLFLRIGILIFGMGTVSVSIYSHLYSPYTRKTNYPEYSQYFSQWERDHESSTCGESSTHSLTQDAKDVLEKSPVKLGNGHESCGAFKVFLHKLAEKLERAGVKAELEKEKVDDILYCPRILFERIFAGIAIVCFVLSLLCLLMNLLCKNEIMGVLSREIDGGYHIICGLGLCCGVGLASYFLHGLKKTCSNELSLRTQFHDGIEKYQQNFCNFDSNSNPSAGGRRTIEEKIEEVNEKLLPRFFEFGRRGSMGDNEVTRSKAKNRALRNRRDVGEKERNENEEKTPRRKRKFSWLKIAHTSEVSEGRSEGSSDQGKHGDNYTQKSASKKKFRRIAKEESSGGKSCLVHFMFYWKLFGIILGAITGLLYITAGINVLHEGRSKRDKMNEGGQVAEEIDTDK